MFALHHRHPTPQPTATRRPMCKPARRLRLSHHSFRRLSPFRQLEIAEKALIDTLQHEGLQVPSHDYVTTQGRAVCDFLGRQPNDADAVHFVQQSTIWDAGSERRFHYRCRYHLLPAVRVDCLRSDAADVPGFPVRICKRSKVICRASTTT